MQEQYIVDFTLTVSLKTRPLAALHTLFLAFQTLSSLALRNDIELRCSVRLNKHSVTALNQGA
jgi:hypothetical protein